MNLSPLLLVRPGTADVNVLRQVYGPPRPAYKLRCPVEPRVVLDLGAYTGISTRWFCDQYPDARVIAVEPHPDRADLARRNAPRAEVLRRAVGAEAGMATLRRNEQGGWADSIIRPGEDVAEVTVNTVDEILGEARAEVVKVDIEGAEREVFRAGGEWLRHVRLLFIETHDRYVPGCTDAVVRALAGRMVEWRGQKPAPDSDLKALIS